MSDQNGVKLIDKKLTRNQNFLVEWLKEHPYCKITVTAQNGDPQEIITQTEDGLGIKTIPIALEIMKREKEIS